MPQERTASPARLRLVEAARGAWVSRLIDTSRCNNLLFFRAGNGTITVDAEPVGMLCRGERPLGPTAYARKRRTAAPALQ